MYRNIRVGDDLSDKILYLSFPDDMYQNFNTQGYIIQAGAKYIGMFMAGMNNEDKFIYISPPNAYMYRNSNGSTTTNLSTITLPSNFGVVTLINTSLIAYQYIKIYEDVRTKAELTIDKKFKVIGELTEADTASQLTTDGNLQFTEFIEGNTFGIRQDGSIEAVEFIEE